MSDESKCPTLFKMHMTYDSKENSTQCHYKGTKYRLIELPKSISPQKWQKVGVLYEWTTSEWGRISTSSSSSCWILMTISTTVSSCMSVTLFTIWEINKVIVSIITQSRSKPICNMHLLTADLQDWYCWDHRCVRGIRPLQCALCRHPVSQEYP